MIKVRVTNMVRKPKRNQEAYTRLGFLPKQKQLKMIELRIIHITHMINATTAKDINIDCNV